MVLKQEELPNPGPQITVAGGDEVKIRSEEQEVEDEPEGGCCDFDVIQTGKAAAITDLVVNLAAAIFVLVVAIYLNFFIFAVGLVILAVNILFCIVMWIGMRRHRPSLVLVYFVVKIIHTLLMVGLAAAAIAGLAGSSIKSLITIAYKAKHKERILSDFDVITEADTILASTLAFAISLIAFCYKLATIAFECYQFFRNGGDKVAAASQRDDNVVRVLDANGIVFDAKTGEVKKVGQARGERGNRRGANGGGRANDGYDSDQERRSQDSGQGSENTDPPLEPPEVPIVVPSPLSHESQPEPGSTETPTKTSSAQSD